MNFRIKEKLSNTKRLKDKLFWIKFFPICIITKKRKKTRKVYNNSKFKLYRNSKSKCV